MLEFNLTVSLPAASLLTVILALVGKCFAVHFPEVHSEEYSCDILIILSLFFAVFSLMETG